MSDRGATAMTDPAYHCGLGATLSVIGGKWKPLVLWHLLFGPHRFGELRRAIGGISEKMLAQHLRELEADGVIRRHQLGGVPPGVEYTLTDLGATLVEALKPLCAWGSDHREAIAAARGLSVPDPIPCDAK